VTIATLNLAKFDLVSIRLAVQCAQTGSLTSAALRCHLALAAASRRIRELESAIGEPLFERHSRGLSLTRAGRVFVKHGLNVLHTIEQLGGELSDQQKGVTRHIRMCASSAAINPYLPPLLAGYENLNPQVRVELEELVSEAVVLSLREGRADIAVFVEGPETTGLHTTHFQSDELVLVLPLQHALSASKSPIAFADTLGEEWISLTSGAALLQSQQQAALAANRPLKLRMQVRSFDAICHLVAAGLGVALLPKSASFPIIKAMKLHWRPLSDAWAQRRLLVATARHVEDPMITALAGYLLTVSQNAKGVRKNKQ
jgi:DNA-binding transcriptional LysR family regulator